MNKILVLLVALILVFVSVGIAEEVPFSEWIAGQDPVVTDVFAEEAPAPEVPTPEAPVPETPVFEPIGVGSRGETVAQLQAKLIELGILNSKADGVFGPITETAVMELQADMAWEQTGTVNTLDEFDRIISMKVGVGDNLLTIATPDDSHDGISWVVDPKKGTITSSGTAQSERGVSSAYFAVNSIFLEPGCYIINNGYVDVVSGAFIRVGKTEDENLNPSAGQYIGITGTSKYGFIFDVNEASFYNISVGIENGVAVENLVFKPTLKVAQ